MALLLWHRYPNKDVLIACKHTVEEIRELVGADSLGFLSLESLPEIVKGKCGGYCDACFSGNYPTQISERLRQGKPDIYSTPIKRLEI